MDQPERALDLVFRFTRGLSFADEPLPSPWADLDKDAIAKEVGGADEHEKPLEEAPGQAAQRLRRQGFVGFLFGFIVVCAAAVFGSALYRRRHLWGGHGGYEEVAEGAAVSADGGPWPQAAAGRGV